MTSKITERHLSWLRTFRGYTEDEAELAAMAADEIEHLRKALQEIADLGDDPSTEFFNVYLADKAREALRSPNGHGESSRV